MTEEESLKEIESLKQKWLLAEADLDNYRKRSKKELDYLQKYSVLPLARDILPALDNLNRAIETSVTDSNINQGLKIVHRQFLEIFARYKISLIAAVGQLFDPNLHKVIQEIPSEKPLGTILQELEIGFKMEDLVVRPSTVVVSAGEKA